MIPDSNVSITISPQLGPLVYVNPTLLSHTARAQMKTFFSLGTGWNGASDKLWLGLHRLQPGFSIQMFFFSRQQ